MTLQQIARCKRLILNLKEDTSMDMFEQKFEEQKGQEAPVAGTD